LDTHIDPERLMAGKTKRLAKAVVTLAATALLEKGIEKAVKAAKDRRVRRKAAELEEVVRKGARTTTRVASRRAKALKAAAEKQVPVVRKKAAKQIERLAKLAAP
jgi:hypothetical protein